MERSEEPMSNPRPACPVSRLSRPAAGTFLATVLLSALTAPVCASAQGTPWSVGTTPAMRAAAQSAQPATQPLRIEPNLRGMSALAGGEGFTLALSTNGRVWTWGSNEHQQLGARPDQAAQAPAAVTGLSGV